MTVLESRSERETRDVAARIGARLTGGEVIGLEGPLGCGKTRFVAGLAQGMGLDPAAVCSPTFIICREYTNHASLTLVHIDAFRLAGPDDLDAIGWDELLEAADTVMAIEWPSRIEPALPESRIDVTMQHLGPQRRRISIAAPPALACCLEDLHG